MARQMWLQLVVLLAAAFRVSGGVLEWSEVPTTGDGPSARRDHAMVSHAGSLYLFGGRTKNGGDLLDDTWRLNISTGIWTVLESDSKPPGRFTIVYALDESSNSTRFIISTGEGLDKEGGRIFYNDVWALDLLTTQWTRLDNPSLGQDIVDMGEIPTKRYGSGGGIIGSNLYVTHGFNGAARYDDTWKFDLVSNTWSDVTPTKGDIPFARCLVGSTATSTEIVMFGGCGSGGYGPCPSHDAWAFEPEQGAWKQLELCAGPRMYSTMSLSPVSPNDVIMVGGLGAIWGSGMPGDIGVFNNVAQAGNVYSVSGVDIEDRAGAVLAYVPGAEAHVLLFGGHPTDTKVYQLAGDKYPGTALACSGWWDMRTLHGVLMLLSWGIILPVGAMIARFGKNWAPPRWFKIHRVSQPFGVFLSLVGLVVAFLMVGAGHFLGPARGHAAIGILVMLMGLQQPINGWCRAHVHEGEPKTRKRIWWERWHKWGGRFMLTLGLINPLLGLIFLSPDSVPVIVLYAIWAASLLTYYVVQTVRGKPESKAS